MRRRRRAIWLAGRSVPATEAWAWRNAERAHAPMTMHDYRGARSTLSCPRGICAPVRLPGQECGWTACPAWRRQRARCHAQPGCRACRYRSGPARAACLTRLAEHHARAGATRSRAWTRHDGHHCATGCRHGASGRAAADGPGCSSSTRCVAGGSRRARSRKSRNRDDRGTRDDASAGCVYASRC